MLRQIFLCAVAAILCFAAVGAAPALRFVGVIQPGVNHFQQYMDSFTRLTGINGTIEELNINVQRLVEIGLNDMKSDRLYDGYLAFSPDQAPYAHDYRKDVRDPAFDYSGITLAAKQNIANYDGAILCMPFDLDAYLLYYRRDLIAAPPSTWDELIETGKFWHGKDINGDGTPDWGICFNMDRLSLTYTTILHTIYNFKAGVRQSSLFDISDDDSIPMTNLMETEGHFYALRILAEMYKLSNPTYVALGSTNNQFADGRCALYVSYPSGGTQTIRPSGAYIKGRMGTTRTPGSKLVYHRGLQKLVPCTTELCSFMEPGNINRPTTVIAGQCVTLREDSPNLAAAIKFAAHMTTTAEVRSQGGINPFRDRHFNATEFTVYGWDKLDAELYLSAIRQGAEQVNSYAWPRFRGSLAVTGNQEKMCGRYLRMPGSVYANETVITEAAVTAFYTRQSLQDTLAAGFSYAALEANIRIVNGLPPFTPKPASGAPVEIIVPIVVIGSLLLAVAAYLGIRKWAATRHAPKDNTFCACFAGPKNVAKMWQLYPDSMGAALTHVSDTMRVQAAEHGCYQVKRVGEFLLIAAKSPAQAANFAAGVEKAMQTTNWTKFFGDGKLTDETAKPGKKDTTSHRSSQRSKKSGRSSHHSTARDAPRILEISVSIHWGSGLVLHDAERDVYDYTGPVVDVAAEMADVAAGGQIILSSDAANTGNFSSAGEVAFFCETPLKSGPMEVHQLNPAGLKVRVFKVAADSDRVDSVTAALEQAGGGLTSKRVTVLALRIHNFVDSCQSLPRDLLNSRYVETFTAINQIVGSNRGHVCSFEGGRVMVTFNAALSTASQLTRAAACAAELAEELRNLRWEGSSCGMAVGAANVGAITLDQMPTHQALVGTAWNQAILLSAVAHKYPGRCLTTSAASGDLATSSYTQTVDVVLLPGARARTALIAVVASRGEEESDEWLYELAKGDAKNPFSVVNRGFDALLSGTPADAVAALEKRGEKPADSVDNSGAETLRTILQHPGGDLVAYATERAKELWGTVIV